MSELRCEPELGGEGREQGECVDTGQPPGAARGSRQEGGRDRKKGGGRSRTDG